MSEAAPSPRWLATRDGRVALLFTDIVGSTERLAALGEARWLDALRAHNALVREQVRVHGGAEVKFTGDGWMVAFAEPRDALRCGVAIQRALMDATDAGFPVRIGVHAGRAVKEGADFLGVAVVVASRLTTAARPREILASWPVRLACGASDVDFGEPREVDIRGLGPHRAFPVRWENLRPGAPRTARAV